MINRGYQQLDILRKRRESSRTKKLTFSNVKKLRRLGFIIGITISLLGVSTCSVTLFHTYKRIKYKEKLEKDAAEYEILRNKYNKSINNIREISRINNQIAQGIVGTKSGSALLLEIRKILPTTIQLKTIKTEGMDLNLKGLANQPTALKYINSLKLQISDSFLFRNKSAFLSRAWETKNNSTKHLNFQISSKFSKPNSLELMANYERLGSFGLLKRVNLLKKEGLIKWQIYPQITKKGI